MEAKLKDTLCSIMAMRKKDTAVAEAIGRVAPALNYMTWAMKEAAMNGHACMGFPLVKGEGEEVITAVDYQTPEVREHIEQWLIANDLGWFWVKRSEQYARLSIIWSKHD